jgi:hypothetical protein
MKGGYSFWSTTINFLSSPYANYQVSLSSNGVQIKNPPLFLIYKPQISLFLNYEMSYIYYQWKADTSFDELLASFIHICKPPSEFEFKWSINKKSTIIPNLKTTNFSICNHVMRHTSYETWEVKELTFKTQDWMEEWSLHKSCKHELLPQARIERKHRAWNGSGLGRRKL